MPLLPDPLERVRDAKNPARNAIFAKKCNQTPKICNLCLPWGLAKR